LACFYEQRASLAVVERRGIGSYKVVHYKSAQTRRQKAIVWFGIVCFSCNCHSRSRFEFFIQDGNDFVNRPLVTDLLHLFSFLDQGRGEGVGRCRGVGRGRGVVVGVTLGVAVTVAVAVGVGVTVAVAVGVGVGVVEGVGVGVGVPPPPVPISRNTWSGAVWPNRAQVILRTQMTQPVAKALPGFCQAAPELAWTVRLCHNQKPDVITSCHAWTETQ
jgi:hypothetical protein